MPLNSHATHTACIQTAPADTRRTLPGKSGLSYNYGFAT